MPKSVSGARSNGRALKGFTNAVVWMKRLLRLDDRAQWRFDEDLSSSFNKPLALPSRKRAPIARKIFAADPWLLSAGALLAVLLAYSFSSDFWLAAPRTSPATSLSGNGNPEAPIIKPRQKPMTVVYKDPDGVDARLKFAAPPSQEPHAAQLPRAIAPPAKALNAPVPAIKKSYVPTTGPAAANPAAYAALMRRGVAEAIKVQAKASEPKALPLKPGPSPLVRSAEMPPAAALRKTLPIYPDLRASAGRFNERNLQADINKPPKHSSSGGILPQKTVFAAAMPSPLPSQVAITIPADNAAQDFTASKIPEPMTPVRADEQRQGNFFSDCVDCPKLVAVQMAQPATVAGLGFVGLPADAAAPKPFALGMSEVTFDEWARCVAEGGCKEKPSDNGWGRGNRPVINVSFKEVSEQYLPWLSRVTKHKYRLPTEAEWELALRGVASGEKYGVQPLASSEASLCDLGNFSEPASSSATARLCSDGFEGTAPVGSFKANSLGIFDLEGNVWEWTADCLRAGFSQDTAKNPVDCNFRVLMGGSWASEAGAPGASARGWEKLEKKRNSIGFRVARSLE